MARFNLDDLLKKDKTELDRIKTAQEVYSFDDRYAFERKKFKTENLRFFGIAILTAFISLGSSYFIESFKQKNTVRQDVKKEFSDLNKSYFDASSKDQKKEIACVLANFDNSIKDKSISTAQVTFGKICNSDSAIHQEQAVITSTDTTTVAMKEAVTKLNIFDKELQELKQQKHAAIATEQTKITQKIAEVNNKINEVVNATPEIKLAVKSSENIEQNVKQIEAVNNSIMQQQPSDKTTTKSAVTWFKEGYFLQFGNYRVLLQYLDKNLGIQVEICKSTSTTPCEKPMLNKAWVKYNNPLQFSDNGHSYRINLEAIDHAGKNPFNLAAYITFEILNPKQ